MITEVVAMVVAKVTIEVISKVVTNLSSTSTSHQTSVEALGIVLPSPVCGPPALHWIRLVFLDVLKQEACFEMFK